MIPDGPLVFVDIDTQRDFLEPDGALYIPGSEAILANLSRLTEFARSRGIPVLATACAHTSEDEELRIDRPHCLLGTPGQERVAATAWPGTRVLQADETLTGDLPLHLTLHKHQYDLFSHPEADRLITLYERDHPTFVVYGVATDYCVKAAVTGLLDRDCRAALVLDAIRAVDAAAEPEILTEFARRGVLLTLTEVVCAG
ncbi:MAG: cysteine hydrolase [Planctomycetaceae bacterium]|nr:cysteine hydrolase [Planctomycetaceae bacterium]